MLRHRVEIVEAALAVLQQSGLVPGRAIFAAATNIGEHIGIAFLDPEQAERASAIGLLGEVSRRLRGAETAIGMDQRGNRSFRSEEHTSELQSLMRSSYAVFCLKKNKQLTGT